MIKSKHIKPTKEAEELAMHELPILRNKLKQIENERRAILEQILIHEDIIGKANDLAVTNIIIDREELASEYFKKRTYSEKILFITEYPNLYGRQLIEGKGDIVNIIYEIEKNQPFTDIKKLQKKLNNSIPSVLSRLYNEKKILKYRYKGTKGKFVVINPSWLFEGKFREEFNIKIKNIEPIATEVTPIN